MICVRNTSVISRKHWESIEDIPLYNWQKCIESNYVYSRKKSDSISKQNDFDVECWFKIYDSYLIKYGLSEVHKKYLNLLRKKALIQLNYVETRDAFKLTQIEMHEVRLKNMLSNAGQGISIETSLIILGKYMGFRVDPKKITANEYFLMLEQYGKGKTV